jgi:nitrate reductase gamma subunit
MHTKINTHPNDPNLLTHVIWSKTSLGMQHIHLELLWILSYLFSKKIKHISIIIISGNHKNVINSPDVYFGITRQHEEVGHKKIIIFGYKDHLGRFCRNGKQFI